MARLVHPGIVALFDSGESDGRLFYVMPFVSGETLRARVTREGRLTPPAAAPSAPTSPRRWPTRTGWASCTAT